MALTTLGLALRQNSVAIPFLVLGLWKFGFPETILTMHMALNDLGSNVADWTIDFLNAVGLVVHHGAASLLICMLLVDVIPAGRRVVEPILILLMQHWFVLLRYVNRILYTILVLTLEVVFQWVVISNFQYLISLHWTAALSGSTMYAAHWIYLIAAGIDMITTGGLGQKGEQAIDEGAGINNP